MSEGATDKRVGWAELFFDLVFVVAVTAVSGLVEDDHSWGGLLRALIVFVPIYWCWVGTAVQTNLLDAERPLLRMRIFLVALAAVVMAVALPDVYGDLGPVFAFAYWAGRIVLGAVVLRPLLAGNGVTVNPYLVSMVLTGPLFVIGGYCHGDVRELIWGLAALLDLSTPTVLRRRLRAIHYDAGHLAERFGLFVLIAIGESVVAVGTSTPRGELDAAAVGAIAIAFVVSCGLWWVYFQFAADAMRHSLATARVQLDITRLVLSYGHLAFIASIVAVAVGLHEAIAEPTHHLHGAGLGLLYGGTAVYLAAFGFTRWTMFGLVSWTRLSAATAVLVLTALAAVVPALVALALVALVLIVLNAVEYARSGQIGWRALRGATVR